MAVGWGEGKWGEGGRIECNNASFDRPTKLQ
jgi:hypothetical protein